MDFKSDGRSIKNADEPFVICSTTILESPGKRRLRHTRL
jgi:hypothetical protein